MLIQTYFRYIYVNRSCANTSHEQPSHAEQAKQRLRILREGTEPAEETVSD